MIKQLNYLIKDFEYETIQTLSYHTNRVYKIVEFKNELLASCSLDSHILFYYKDINNEYQKEYEIKVKGFCLFYH